MQMIYCTCNVSVLESLLKIIEENKIRAYQVIDQVTAKNKLGAPRFNDPVWPGYNSAVLLQVKDAEKVDRLAKEIKAFNQNAFNESELVTFCSWNLNHYFFD
ncbi:PG0541 family transporter-associated protein [Natronoflexus pectinivorans]|uniref:Nitrogen regulatory protein P-II family n=1 Tax=Natronoflexus pectinivorans TaxID=682526 RepID=A0A4R2GK53_9BACT|nr:PG0541 family transporter-associated protein [Natronoflexus pectinivorans]TCO09142.1 hypothetical protein EV194_10353 [Natronoflexus pectinivorans]